MKRGHEKKNGRKTRTTTRMGDALVTHDGPRGQDAEKMYIRSDTAKDTAVEGRKGILTDVSPCRVYATSITPILLYLLLYIYLTAASLFCSAARIRCATAYSYDTRVPLYQFLLPFIYLDDRYFCVCCTCTCVRENFAPENLLPLIAFLYIINQNLYT